MDRIAIDLPEELATFLRDQAGAEPGSSEERDYLLGLIEQERRRHHLLMADLQEGLDSPDSDMSFDDIWERAVRRAESPRAA